MLGESAVETCSPMGMGSLQRCSLQPGADTGEVGSRHALVHTALSRKDHRNRGMGKDIKDVCKGEKNVSQDGLQSVNPSFKMKTHHTRTRTQTHTLSTCLCIPLGKFWSDYFKCVLPLRRLRVEGRDGLGERVGNLVFHLLPFRII